MARLLKSLMSNIVCAAMALLLVAPSAPGYALAAAETYAAFPESQFNATDEAGLADFGVKVPNPLRDSLRDLRRVARGMVPAPDNCGKSCRHVMMTFIAASPPPLRV